MFGASSENASQPHLLDEADLLAMSISTVQQAILFAVLVVILATWFLVVHNCPDTQVLFGLSNMNLLIHLHVLVEFVRL